MYIRKFALGDASPIEIGLTSTVFLTGFIGAVILPFYLYLFGAGIFWEFLGVSICILIVWNFESYRLMRYSKKSLRIVTLPGFFEYRFGAKGYFIRLLAAVEIIVIPIVITALVLKEAAIVLYKVLGFPQEFIIIVMSLAIALLVGIFGLDLFVKLVRFKTLIMLLGVILLVVFLLYDIGLNRLIRNMMEMDILGSVSDYMNILFHDGKPLMPSDYVSLISMGLLASGMPFMLGLFFAEKDGAAINVGKIITVIYVFIFFASLACLGAISRGVLYPNKITNSVSDYISLMFQQIRNIGQIGRMTAVIYMIVIVLGFATAIEGAFHSIITSLYEDIICCGRVIRVDHRKDKRNIIITSVFVGIITAMIAMGIKNMSIGLILVFLGALGCSISPTLFMSLAWKRMNKFGCVAGLIVGLGSVPVFKYAAIFDGNGVKETLCDIIGINSVIPSMLFTVFMIMVVSLLSPQPEEKQVEEFLEVKHRIME